MVKWLTIILVPVSVASEMGEEQKSTQYLFEFDALFHLLSFGIQL